MINYICQPLISFTFFFRFKIIKKKKNKKKSKKNNNKKNKKNNNKKNNKKKKKKKIFGRLNQNPKKKKNIWAYNISFSLELILVKLSRIKSYGVRKTTLTSILGPFCEGLLESLGRFGFFLRKMREIWIDLNRGEWFGIVKFIFWHIFNILKMLKYHD